MPSSSSVARAFGVRPERLGLAARPIEGEHEQLAKPLAEGVLQDERLELRDEVGGTAELDLGRDPLLDRDGTELVKTPGFGLRPLLEGELGQRRAAPEVERAHEERAALLGGCGSRVGEHLLEATRVDLLG